MHLFQLYFLVQNLEFLFFQIITKFDQLVIALLLLEAKVKRTLNCNLVVLHFKQFLSGVNAVLLTDEISRGNHCLAKGCFARDS